MKGLDELIKKVKKMPDAIKEEVDKELDDGAQLIQKEALLLSPAREAGGHGLRSHMWIDTTEFLLKKVGNHSEYAAYQEFGTGFHAADYVITLPKDWQEYAKSFFVNGEGRVPAHPFLYPAYEKARPVIIDRIKNVLKNMVDK